MSKIDKTLYQDGVRFECTGCGQCCKARGRYGFIYVTPAERRQLAAHLGMRTSAFTRKHCASTDGLVHLRDPSNNCQFLSSERCTVYAARPGQCRNWPFWPENMTQKVWNSEVKRDCPGVGIGRLYTPQEIELRFADERRRDEEMGAV